MFLTSTMTVDEYMQEKLIARGLNVGEFDRAFEYAKRKLDEFGFAANALIPRKQGVDVLIKDCWNTLVNEYPEGALDELWERIEDGAFTWCINYMHSLL